MVDPVFLSTKKLCLIDTDTIVINALTALKYFKQEGNSLTFFDEKMESVVRSKSTSVQRMKFNGEYTVSLPDRRLKDVLMDL